MFISVATARSMFASVLAVSFGVLLFAQVSAEDFPPAGDILQGSKTWADNCARCHNLRSPRELRDDQWITTVFHMRMRAGLTGQQARDVLSFLQASNSSAGGTMSLGDAVAVSGAGGASIYDQTCVACHGENGKGAIPGVPDLTRADGPLSQRDGVLLDHMSRGFRSAGSQLAMPPRGGNPSLTDADLQAVLRYLRQTFGG